MKRSLPTDQDEDSPSSQQEPNPSKVRRKGKGLVSALRTLTASGSGSDKSIVVDHGGCLPTPPSTFTKSAKHKSSFSQRISKVNTLFRAPFEGASSQKSRQKEKPFLKSQHSVETVGTVQTGSVLSPASSNKTVTTASSSNSYDNSAKSLASTGKTSLDSKFTSPSDRGHSNSPEKKQLNSGTVVMRQNRSSPESNLAPIEETALDYASVTILTVERAAAAKIYLETHFNNLLSSDPAPRSMRRRKLEAELRRLMHDENFTPEEQEQLRADYYRRETDHLREYRVMKTRSIQARNAEKGYRAPSLDSDYEVLKILGKGSFGVVRLVRERSKADLHNGGSPGHAAKQVYAMKVIRKSDMLRTSQEGHLRAERDFLVASEGSDWIVPLVASFQDAANLYLVMEYMPGGDFLGLLIRENVLHETVARFYVAEMIICIEAAHALKWIHRDVKPDNFLISASGHLKISDFGLAFDGHWSHDMAYYNSHRYSLVHKLGIRVEGDEQDKEESRSMQATLKWTSGIMAGIEKHDKKDANDGEPLLDWRNRCGNRRSAMSVVGTSQYMAPEVVAGKPYDARCDWWSIGVILYECIYGHTPFLSEEGRQMTKRNILRHHETLGFPARPPVSHRCRQLMEALIRDKEDRLSSKRYKFKDLASASPSFAGLASASGTRAGASPGSPGPTDFSGRYVFPNDAEDIKAHKWFRGIPWDRLHQLEPPFVPRIRSVDDTHYFDEEDEISDWSDTAETTEPSDDATPTMPQATTSPQHRPQHMGTTSSSPLMTTPTTTTAAAAAALSSPLPAPPHPLGPTAAAPPPAADPEARLFLRTLGLTRSQQSWALSAITQPHDPARLQAQLDELFPPARGLDAERASRLRHFVRLFAAAAAPGRKGRRARARDRLLRDAATRAVALDVRRRTAFLGYTWRRAPPPAVERARRGRAVPEGWGGMAGAAASGGAGVDGMFEADAGAAAGRHGLAGFACVGGPVGGGEEYDYGYGFGGCGYGSGWGGASFSAATQAQWEHVGTVGAGAPRGKGRFSWR